MNRLWLAFILVMVASFTVLGWIGARIYRQAPPIPDYVMVAGSDTVVFDQGAVRQGQNVWQSLGGMELGSIWGHGSYVAPDWTADWLHREAVFILETWAKAEYSESYSELTLEEQMSLQGKLQQMMRENTYEVNEEDGRITIFISAVRAKAIEANKQHYAEIFSKGNAAYAIPPGTVNDATRLDYLSAFFFWTAWAAVTDRPGEKLSYTSNWPHEPLVGNRPTGDTIVWTGVSIILLLAGICAMVWWYASQSSEDGGLQLPADDPLRAWQATPSQRATMKYFFVVAIMILVQILTGVITAHYGVEGDGFYGIPLSDWLPYSVTRTWHVQLGLLWIATAWLAAGLFIGPLVSGKDPQGQHNGVTLLFYALLFIVAGSLAGQWLSIHQVFTDLFFGTSEIEFYLGHQGYEYVDLGRFWQICLFIGLLFWLFLVIRASWPALTAPLEREGETPEPQNLETPRPPNSGAALDSGGRSLLVLFLIAAGAIGLFYAAGLTWGQHTHLSIVEYWRWWVIHLWVEGFFEVFATTVVAFFFARLGLIRPGLAAKAALLSATIYLSGGIIGTCHHLYWSGTPTVALAFGSVFSALEVVPLVLVAYPAIADWRMLRATPWMQRYRWPIYFFVAVAFWNMVGAGLFGFMINPPIALYYMQGLNTTPVHAHAALFGVYGMLGIGLMLVCLRAMMPQAAWNDRLIGFSFWAMNIGLFAMCVFSLLPVGLMQTWASVEHGYWYARSHEFLGTGVMQTFRWLRIPGDTIFALGALALVWFVLKLPFTKAGEPGA
ncbi:MAG: nitric-oxide reductase large subunit [Planctomycetes bacterium]|nr:nitric-oxide reductase large subunit [Planctomycetota bacterium]